MTADSKHKKEGAEVRSHHYPIPNMHMTSNTNMSTQSSSSNDARKSSGRKTKYKYINRKQCEGLLSETSRVIVEANTLLGEAKVLAYRAGFTIESQLVPKDTMAGATATTGGHSNTDHEVLRMGDPRKDRIAELKRQLLRRARASKPENKHEDRWDKPRIPGERRRRILRDKDSPAAPVEPPLSGYNIFLSHYTTKFRHDHPDDPHVQARVTMEAAEIWGKKMSRNEKVDYKEFAEKLKNEYQGQYVQFRATGSFHPSQEFERLEGTNIWVRKDDSKRSKLEREICSYDTVIFPKRPPSMDEDYNQRANLSADKRRERERAKASSPSDSTD